MVRPQFSVRAFLGFVALVAILCWQYPTLRRAWLEYRLPDVATEFGTAKKLISLEVLVDAPINREGKLKTPAIYKNGATFLCSNGPLTAERACTWLQEALTDEETQLNMWQV